jgi:homoserine dehydrogenase
MRLAINGFGNIGQAFAELLQRKQAELNLAVQVVAIVTRSRGRIYSADGLALDEILSLGQLPDESWHLADLLRTGKIDVLIEATPTDLQTGGSALDTFRVALTSGVHVVTVNKGPLAVAYQELRELSQTHNAKLLFEGTVMAGTPSIRLAQSALKGNQILSARGILNGTTNYILTEMETGMSYADALAQAQALGYAEPDPSGDVDGWDAAAKVLILSNMLYDNPLKLDDLRVTGITGITLEAIQQAQKEGKHWKLIAEITPQGGSVAPVLLSADNPLSSVGGATNAITYQTELLGDVTLIGAGAGRVETAFAILADVLSLLA